MTKPRTPSRLIFLPGALGDRNFWKPLANELSCRAERVFVAYPGFAGVPADPSITCIDQLVDAIVARIDRPSALIAQSMGGVLAIQAAIRKPLLITHLVLVASSGGLNTSELGAIDWRKSVERDHPNLPNWFTSYRADLTAELSSVNVPVLLIWGECDPLSPVAVGKALLNQFRNAVLHVIPGGEHDLALVHARSVAPLIDAHLQNR